jgi:hypothetical protein
VLTGIIGARRVWTVSMISALSIPMEVDRRDAEVAVPELALDDHEGHTFASHLDGVGVPELMWSEPSADTCSDGGAPQLGSGGRQSTTGDHASGR